MLVVLRAVNMDRITEGFLRCALERGHASTSRSSSKKAGFADGRGQPLRRDRRRVPELLVRPPPGPRGALALPGDAAALRDRLPPLPRARVRRRRDRCASGPAAALPGTSALPAALRLLAQAGFMRRAYDAFLRGVEKRMPLSETSVDDAPRVRARRADRLAAGRARLGPGRSPARRRRGSGSRPALIVASWDNLTTKGAIRDTPRPDRGLERGPGPRGGRAPRPARRERARRRRPQPRPLVHMEAEHGAPRSSRPRSASTRTGRSCSTSARRDSSPAPTRSSSCANGRAGCAATGDPELESLGGADPPSSAELQELGARPTSRSRGGSSSGRAAASPRPTAEASTTTSTRSTTPRPSSGSTPARSSTARSSAGPCSRWSATQFRDTQTGTIHFSYLAREEGGGLLNVAESWDEHFEPARRRGALASMTTASGSTTSCARSSGRNGLDQPAAPLAIEAIERGRRTPTSSRCRAGGPLRWLVGVTADGLGRLHELRERLRPAAVRKRRRQREKEKARERQAARRPASAQEQRAKQPPKPTAKKAQEARRQEPREAQGARVGGVAEVTAAPAAVRAPSRPRVSRDPAHDPPDLGRPRPASGRVRAVRQELEEAPPGVGAHPLDREEPARGPDPPRGPRADALAGRALRHPPPRDPLPLRRRLRRHRPRVPAAARRRHRRRAFVATYFKPGRVTNTFIASVPSHPLLERALREIRPREIYGFDKEVAGPPFLARLCAEYSDVSLSRAASCCSRTPRRSAAKAVGIHHMSRTWKDADGLREAMLRAEQRLAKTKAKLDEERRRHARPASGSRSWLRRSGRAKQPVRADAPESASGSSRDRPKTSDGESRRPEAGRGVRRRSAVEGGADGAPRRPGCADGSSLLSRSE